MEARTRRLRTGWLGRELGDFLAWGAREKAFDAEGGKDGRSGYGWKRGNGSRDKRIKERDWLRRVFGAYYVRIRL